MSRSWNRRDYEKDFAKAGGASLTLPGKQDAGKEAVMHEEVNQRVVVLSIRTARFTAEVLAKAVRMYLNARNKSKYNKTPQIKHGKMTVKELMEQNAGALNCEVDPNNIKGFERIARKYHVDYAVKKNTFFSPPKYIVFFKARDQDTIDLAFNEFKEINNNKKEREPFKNILKRFKDLSLKLSKNREFAKEKNRVKEHSL